MRILHTIGRIESGPQADAAEAALLDAARWQLGRGDHVVLAAPPRATISESARSAGLTIVAVEPASTFAAREATLLRAAVRAHAIEVIHAHDEAASVLALMCADLCPVVRTLDQMPADALPFDHVIVGAAALRNRLVKAELIEPEHVTVANGGAEARLERLIDAYERAIVRSLTGRLIPARFVAGPPQLRRLAPLAAE
jgi:hypothetical protein